WIISLISSFFSSLSKAVCRDCVFSSVFNFSFKKSLFIFLNCFSDTSFLFFILSRQKSRASPSDRLNSCCALHTVCHSSCASEFLEVKPILRKLSILALASFKPRLLTYCVICSRFFTLSAVSLFFLCVSNEAFTEKREALITLRSSIFLLIRA